MNTRNFGRLFGNGFVRTLNFYRNGLEKSILSNRYGSVRSYAIGRHRIGISTFNSKKLLFYSVASPFSSKGPSTSQGSEKDLSLREIFGEGAEGLPEIPAPPFPVEASESVKRLLEENFHELGLGSYFTPVGWIQNLLHVLHSSTGLPWWEVIILATVMIRACTLPIIISSQRRSAAMLENQPHLQKLADKMEAARRAGDRFQTQMAALEMQEFLKEKHLPTMARTLAPMFANAAIFTCYFLALRGMATKSLVSMKSEGMLWFPDLTVPDPLLILPTMCALSTLLVIEVGIESGVGAQQLQPGIRWALRIMPFGILLIAGKIPAAVMCYWFTSNIISLILSILFRNAAIRRVLKIPALPPGKKTSLRESWRLPQFVRDYLSGPALMVRSVREKIRKTKSSTNAGKTESRSDEKSRRPPG